MQIHLLDNFWDMVSLALVVCMAINCSELQFVSTALALSFSVQTEKATGG